MSGTHADRATCAAPGAAGGHVTFRVSDHWFALPVASVREVLGTGRVARLPLAPDDVAGLLNLRGDIVTVIDVRVRLGLGTGDTLRDGQPAHVVIEHDEELFALAADEIGDVAEIGPADDAAQPVPVRDPLWDGVAAGVVQHAGVLLVTLDPGAVVAGPAGSR